MLYDLGCMKQQGTGAGAVDLQLHYIVLWVKYASEELKQQ